MNWINRKTLRLIFYTQFLNRNYLQFICICISKIRKKYLRTKYTITAPCQLRTINCVQFNNEVSRNVKQSKCRYSVYYHNAPDTLHLIPFGNFKMSTALHNNTIYTLHPLAFVFGNWNGHDLIWAHIQKNVNGFSQWHYNICIDICAVRWLRIVLYNGPTKVNCSLFTNRMYTDEMFDAKTKLHTLH